MPIAPALVATQTGLHHAKRPLLAEILTRVTAVWTMRCGAADVSLRRQTWDQERCRSSEAEPWAPVLWREVTAVTERNPIERPHARTAPAADPQLDTPTTSALRAALIGSAWSRLRRTTKCGAGERRPAIPHAATSHGRDQGRATREHRGQRSRHAAPQPPSIASARLGSAEGTTRGRISPATHMKLPRGQGRPIHVRLPARAGVEADAR